MRCREHGEVLMIPIMPQEQPGSLSPSRSKKSPNKIAKSMKSILNRYLGRVSDTSSSHENQRRRLQLARQLNYNRWVASSAQQPALEMNADLPNGIIIQSPRRLELFNSDKSNAALVSSMVEAALQVSNDEVDATDEVQHEKDTKVNLIHGEVEQHSEEFIDVEEV
jgi:hypothetical protein